jgi:hypothetical protein
VAQAERQVILAEAMYIGQQVEQATVTYEAREQLAEAQRQEILMAVTQNKMGAEARDTLTIVARNALVSGNVRDINERTVLGDMEYPEKMSEADHANANKMADAQSERLERLQSQRQARNKRPVDKTVVAEGGRVGGDVEHIDNEDVGGKIILRERMAGVSLGRPSALGLHAEQARAKRQNEESKDQSLLGASANDSLSENGKNLLKKPQ